MPFIASLQPKYPIGVIFFFVIYGRFVLSHLASQFLRLCMRSGSPWCCGSLKGSNFPSAVWKQRDGARKGELARTVRYERDARFFFFVRPQTGIQREWKELFL